MNELQIELECNKKKLLEKCNFINELLNKLIDNGLSQSCAFSIINSIQNNKVMIFNEIREQEKDAMKKVIVIPDINIEMLFRDWLKNEESTND